MLDGLDDCDGSDERVTEGSKDGIELKEGCLLAVKDGYSDGTREGKQDGAVVEHPLIAWLVFNEPRVGVPPAAHVKDEASHPSPVKYQCAVFGRPATIVVGV